MANTLKVVVSVKYCCELGINEYDIDIVEGDQLVMVVVVFAIRYAKLDDNNVIVIDCGYSDG